MQARLRGARPQDAKLIHGLICALAEYEREPDAVVCTPDDLRAQLSSERPPFECVLAELDGRAVGFALFFHNYSTWRGRSGLYLEDLFVVPEFRHRGIGRKLLTHLAGIAVERGCARMEWAVLDWNAPAIEFYRGLGARPMEEWTIFRLTDDALARLGAEGG
jgi:GNAT superfamily N-acetyltransferase